MKMLILFAGLCAFVSADEDYNFDTEEFDDEYEDALGLKKPMVNY